MDKDRIYLNNNALTMPCKAALEREEDSSLFYKQEKIFRFLKADPTSSLVFTSNGAEAITQVLFSVFFQLSRNEGKTHFITSALEDAPTMQMMKRLEDLGCFVKIAPVKQDGTIDVEELKKLITPRTALISISMAQGATGVIQPVEEIGEIAREKGILFHLDGTHSVGKYDFSLQELQPDYFTFSGDRIHSVIGSGALLAKAKAPLISLIAGGKGLRGGNLDTTSAFALCAAIDQASLFLDMFTLETARLKSFFEKELLRRIPGAQVLLKKSIRLPNTTVIAFPQVHQEALFSLLKRKKVETLLGGGEMQYIAALLLASKIDPSLAASALSFSFSRMTTEEELQRAIEIIAETAILLQKQAPSFPLPPADPLTYSPSFAFGKKLRDKTSNPRFIGSFTEAPFGMRYVSAKEKNIHLHALIDTSDGVIADVKFQAFGPLALIGAAEIGSELMMRKTYLQAARISADLIDQHGRDSKEIPAFPKEANALLNQVVQAIEGIVDLCTDIPTTSNDYDATPIAMDLEENPNGMPGWEAFSIPEKTHLIESVITKEIRPYIELDEGGVRVIGVNSQHEITIAYEGACTTCHSSTGSTLSAIQQILRARLYPKIRVIPYL